jgi:FtsP/CotA-like multicopper oxidase with cupredoxin domain
LSSHFSNLFTLYAIMKFAASALFHVLLAPTAVGLPASSGLSDPDIQPKFTTIVPNALHPSFMFDASSSSAGNPIEVSVSNDTTLTGLVDSAGTPLETPIWGYGTPQLGYTWPGRTFSVVSGVTTYVKWLNRIPVGPGYLLTGKNNSALGDYTGRSVVDKSFHWAFSIPGYKGYTIENVGTPIIPHLHGGHQDAPYDGNPEFFFTPFFGVVGPQWGHDVFEYDNSQPAGALWYHDHALGITRLNVNSGMAGFYFVRDEEDSGTDENPLGLPAFPYEVALAIQDRMFKETGELFWPAFPGDPFWTDFIEDEGAQVGNDEPSGLAEFFGDHIVVNG